MPPRPAGVLPRTGRHLCHAVYGPLSGNAPSSCHVRSTVPATLHVWVPVSSPKPSTAVVTCPSAASVGDLRGPAAVGGEQGRVVAGVEVGVLDHRGARRSRCGAHDARAQQRVLTRRACREEPTRTGRRRHAPRGRRPRRRPGRCRPGAPWRRRRRRAARRPRRRASPGRPSPTSGPSGVPRVDVGPGDRLVLDPRTGDRAAGELGFGDRRRAQLRAADAVRRRFTAV